MALKATSYTEMWLVSSPSSLTALSQASLPGPKYQAFGIEAQNCSYQFRAMISSLQSGSPAAYTVSCILSCGLIQSWTLGEGKVLHSHCKGAYNSQWGKTRTLIKRACDWKRRREGKMEYFSIWYFSTWPNIIMALFIALHSFILFWISPTHIRSPKLLQQGLFVWI